MKQKIRKLEVESETAKEEVVHLRGEVGTNNTGKKKRERGSNSIIQDARGIGENGQRGLSSA